MERIVKISCLPGILLFTSLLFFIQGICAGQGQQAKPVLERTITIKFTNQRIDVVLSFISQLAGFNFSYNPSLIKPDKLVSGNFSNKPVREILNHIFEGSIEYKEKKGYLILQKARKAPLAVEEQPDEYIYSGYVRDEAGVPLSWVSVYDRASLESTVSNDYGFYRIRFSQKHLPLTLFFSKQGFHDTAVFIQSNSPEYMNMTLAQKFIATPPAINYDSLSRIAENSVGSFFNNLNRIPNEKNISDTIYRRWQVSVLPYIGTNLKLSGNVINEYSFNIFGGLSLGTSKAELAGFFNLNKGDVKYAQVAGFTNLAGGSVEGVQIAGFTNMVKRDVAGVQVAGFVNADFSDVNGVVIAGFVNSIAGKSKGAQVAGFVNSSLHSIEGFQLAGFCNVAGKSMKGTQLATFCNVVSDTLYGTQLGFVNYAGQLLGSQLGFLNYCDSTNGVPVGLMSFVNKGYHKIEISADEILPVNIAFRSGVNAFHNIITSGFDPFSGDSLLWNFGYGIGTSLRVSPKTLLELDITSSQIVKGNSLVKINLINKAYVGIDTRLGKKISLAAGITVNGQLTNTEYTNYPDIFSYYKPNIFYSHTWELDDTQLQMWLGGKVALRFF